jgi:hypothetical protein
MTVWISYQSIEVNASGGIATPGRFRSRATPEDTMSDKVRIGVVETSW